MEGLSSLLDIRRPGDPPKENPFPGETSVTMERMQKVVRGSLPTLLPVQGGVWRKKAFKRKRAVYFVFEADE